MSGETPKDDATTTQDDSSTINDTSTPPAAATTANAGMQDLVNRIRNQTLQNQPDQQQLQQHLNAANNSVEKHHAFWATQPMPHDRMAHFENTIKKGTKPSTKQQQQLTPKPASVGPIQPSKPTSELRQQPYNMPKGFEWCEIDVTNPVELNELYSLLTHNYVEDDDCMFRFDYSPEFLTWALTPPNFTKDFHLGVRSSNSKSKKLMAFISGVPADIRSYEETTSMVEINFLCVHKKLRSKRLAPVLIKEITRRVNMTGVFQAVYTAGLVLPVPVGSCRYWHRSLDPKKLIEVGFSRLSPRMTMARTMKLYKLPAQPTIEGLRPMTPADIPSAKKLLNNYLSKFSLAPMMTDDDFAHWLLPREGVVNSYVRTKTDSEEVTDLCSYYHLPSTVMQNPKHNLLKAAYSFYNVATSVELKDLMNNCLILAKMEGQDVFNALNVMDNEGFLQDLKFGIGDGRLQYYLYNWSCPTMEAKDIGLVLL